MTFTPYTHSVLASEIKDMEALGFSFQGSSNPADQFINTHFPNFDLPSVLKIIDAILSPLTIAAVYRQVLLTDGLQPKMEIQFYSEDWSDKNTGLALCRIFTLEDNGPVVDHEFFRIPRVARGKGIFRTILLALFQQYVNIGARKILVHAALEDGALAWANLNFMATDKEEVDEILAAAQARLSPGEFRLVKLIYDKYYIKNPVGQAFPMFKWAEMTFMKAILKQSHWHGAVDLTNPTEFSNFVANAFG
jgi:hypothetical protein